ncbi:MAG: AsnC family transcriptional regulator [Nanobdellota archaeon]
MLSKNQKKLLKLLAINCRYTNKDIATILRVSQDTIEYQIQNLIGKHDLGHFTAKFDYWMLGYSDYHYLVRLKDISRLPLEKVKQLPFITFCNTSYGKYDVQFIVVATSHDEFREHLTTINEILGDNIQEFSISQAIDIYKYNNIIPPIQIPVKKPKNKKKAIYKLDMENFIVKKEKQFSPDALDMKLVRLLMENPRESYLQLAKSCDVSHETIRNRIARFVNTGFLRTCSINFDYNKFGYFTNFVFLKLKNIDDSSLNEYFESEERIFYAARLIGEYSCIFYTLTKDPKEFGELVNKLRTHFKDNILSAELLYFQNISKYTQFPENLL